jgi:hypothetical protein
MISFDLICRMSHDEENDLCFEKYGLDEYCFLKIIRMLLPTLEKNTNPINGQLYSGSVWFAKTTVEYVPPKKASND